MKLYLAIKRIKKKLKKKKKNPSLMDQEKDQRN